jgi:hypothetical protein
LSVSDGKITHDANCITYVAALQEVCDLMKSLAFTKGPWKYDFRSKVTLTYEQKCNKDSEGKLRCPKSHQLKRFDAPFKDEEEDGFNCQLCKKGFLFSEGYYNCDDRNCYWDVCALCFEKEVSK